VRRLPRDLAVGRNAGRITSEGTRSSDEGRRTIGGSLRHGLGDRMGTMSRRDFYTLTQAARVLEISQRRLLEMLETGEIEGEQDPQSSRWKIPKHAVHELVPAGSSPESPTEDFPEQSTEMLLDLVDELGNLQREVGRLRHSLDLARRAEKEEKERLLADLKQEREQAERTLRVERDRLLEGQRRERERADRLQEEANRLREELESERNKGSWRRLFGG
jgi:excisionase family DNA binding protein